MNDFLESSAPSSCITPRQNHHSSTANNFFLSIKQVSNSNGHAETKHLDDENNSSMYRTPPRKHKTFDSSSSNLASTASMTTVSDMSLTPQHACTSMIESDMVSYDSFISRTSQFSSSTFTLLQGENSDKNLMNNNIERKSSILDELLQDESDFIIMVESPPSSPMKKDTPIKESQNIEYSITTSSISVNNSNNNSPKLVNNNPEISGYLSPPMLNKKQFSRSFNDISSQTCERNLFENSPTMDESQSTTRHIRRETLTPVTAAFLKQARTQRNSLARKGNFVHRLSMRKFKDFSDFQIFNSQNSENLEKSKKLAHQEIFERMKTNQGKSICELSQEFSIVLIFVKSFLCPYSSLSIGNMNRQLTKMLSMNVMPVFVIFGEESTCENGGLSFEGLNDGSENRRNSVILSGLKKSWRSFRKKPKESSNSSSSLDTIFGTNFTQSNYDKFSQYKQLVQSFNRVYDSTGEFFQYFNVNKLPVQSTINLSSLFSAINITMQGFKVGITTDHVSQFKRLPALFLIHNNAVMEYKFVDMQEKPEYIEFMIDANSEECVDSEMESSISGIEYDLNTPDQDFDKENKEIITTIHPEQFVYTNNVQQPSNQYRELSDNFSKQKEGQKKGIRRTLSCFFGQNNSPTCSPRKRSIR
ncbi:hypothetical protein NAEGRDRAFT_79352 [Naegleria gruberi]|uniref:Uncharacterized protein n=1 Tax=Naegleria gruberi TaxID=5762 RepID=D2VBU4_NAEGR|nr:uncharacterized protein NAEGRDRAFT_79352 [Naegleria gruberi]EFC45528.1 hypothetical protein NAEGRDRAFT_79352 [Naegleria gruberi]|eukprot:XP_002678272.1 hypothetical protein NAEGRDRAFT_79352 [Naegleria gruberi strain NEG-M]